ncbi:Autophagy protein [Lachnellula hyalina]|uniref:Autophagy protein n=1 Tax=Lachnellula hyalina TaxID=1316788 RepID=A0A8H8TWI5_9HELO|nr:Autophagy protein [Lachnellula hyalina]TVY24939.1 Autophagy protein [Lachnellula hyalina]
MASWRNEYIQALHERDRREKASYQQVDDQLIEAFTQLLDRTTALEAEKASREPHAQDSKPREPSTTTPTEGTSQIRSDLAEALRSNGQLQSRIKGAEAEVAKLRAKSKSDGKLIDELSRERGSLAQKLKDKEEELRGKAKLLSDVQDEVISLDMELNLSGQATTKLKAENKELIDRWMVYKSREVEAMNSTLH